MSHDTDNGRAGVPHITDMREHLMAALAALRDRENPMDVDRAKALAQVAGVLVDSAKVEVEYLRVTGGEQSAFLESEKDALPALPNGIVGITRHRMAR